jgi:hypothetical protein
MKNPDLLQNFLYAPDPSVRQHNFDAVGMERAFGQQLCDGALRQFAGALVGF